MTSVFSLRFEPEITKIWDSSNTHSTMTFCVLRHRYPSKMCTDMIPKLFKDVLISVSIKRLIIWQIRKSVLSSSRWAKSLFLTLWRNYASIVLEGWRKPLETQLTQSYGYWNCFRNTKRCSTFMALFPLWRVSDSTVQLHHSATFQAPKRVSRKARVKLTALVAGTIQVWPTQLGDSRSPPSTNKLLAE